MKKETQFIVSSVFNAFVIINVVIATLLIIFTSQPAPDGLPTSGFQCLRFFTIDANILSAVSCACVMAYGLRKMTTPKWATILKFISAVSAAITVIAVIFFLGPTNGFYDLLVGSNFFLHILCPIFCVLSLLFFDDLSKFKFTFSIISLAPIIAYGLVYFLMVIVFQLWPDYYDFNTAEQWYIPALNILMSTFCISSVLWVILKTIQNSSNK